MGSGGHGRDVYRSLWRRKQAKIHRRFGAENRIKGLVKLRSIYPQVGGVLAYKASAKKTTRKAIPVIAFDGVEIPVINAQARSDLIKIEPLPLPLLPQSFSDEIHTDGILFLQV